MIREILQQRILYPKKMVHFYGKLYKENHLNGGHIIMLNARDSKYYEEDKVQAKGVESI